MTRAQRELVDAVLANDEASTDDELIALFVCQYDIPENDAREAINQRTNKLNSI